MIDERTGNTHPNGEDGLVERYLRGRGAVDVPPDLGTSIQSAIRAQGVERPLVGRIGWIGAAAALALLLFLAATFASLPRGPGDRTPAGSVGTAASGGPDDPFPSEIQGLHVRSVGEAIAADRRRELDGRAVAIAGYFSWDQRSYFTCGAWPKEEPGELELYCFEGQWALAEQDESIVRPDQGDPAFRYPFRGPSLIPHLPPLLTSAQGWPQDEAFAVGRRAAPVVFIGHFRDPRARLCRPEAIDSCGERFVVDKLAWIAGEYVPLMARIADAQESPRRVLEEPWQLAMDALREPALVLSMAALPAPDVREQNPLLGAEGDESTTVWYVTGVEDVGGEDRYTALAFDDATGRLLTRTELPLPAPPPTEDPVPSSVLGLSVRTVGEAIALRDRGGLDGMVVAIAGYFSMPPLHPCPSTLPQPLILPTDCNDEGELAELDEPVGRPVSGGWEGHSFAGPHLRPVFPPYASGSALEPARASYDAPAETLRVVIVGHFGDRRADACPPEDRERCADGFIVDRVAWVAGADLGVSSATSFQALPQAPARHDQEVLAEVEALLGPDSKPLSIVALSEAEIARIDPLGGVHSDGSRTLWYVHAVDAVGNEDRLVTLVFADPSLNVVAASPTDGAVTPESSACPSIPGATSESDLDPASVWCDATGLEVSTDRLSLIRGASHCGWESVLFLTVGWPVGTQIDRYQLHQYVRDPERAGGSAGRSVRPRCRAPV